MPMKLQSGAFKCGLITWKLSNPSALCCVMNILFNNEHVYANELSEGSHSRLPPAR